MKPAVGPQPRFSEIQVQMVLEYIARHGRVGRKQIVKGLGIGEGSVRTILNQLKERELITSSRGGHALTVKGRRLLSRLLRYVKVDVDDLTVGKVNVATVVRRAASRIKRGIEQRDEAIKAGADGATVLIFKGGKLRFPDGFAEVSGDKALVLTKALRPKEGDVVVIGSASDAVRAEAGARAVVRTLRTRT